MLLLRESTAIIAEKLIICSQHKSLKSSIRVFTVLILLQTVYNRIEVDFKRFLNRFTCIASRQALLLKQSKPFRIHRTLILLRCSGYTSDTQPHISGPGCDPQLAFYRNQRHALCGHMGPLIISDSLNNRLLIQYRTSHCVFNARGTGGARAT